MTEGKKYVSAYYILDADGNPVPEPDLKKWGEWYSNSRKPLVQTQVGESWVSTVFLGTDHRFGGRGPPILWETLVFDGPCKDEGDRYTSREEALAGHAKYVAMVREVTFGKEWMDEYKETMGKE